MGDEAQSSCVRSDLVPRSPRRNITVFVGCAISDPLPYPSSISSATLVLASSDCHFASRDEINRSTVKKNVQKANEIDHKIISDFNPPSTVILCR